MESFVLPVKLKEIIRINYADDISNAELEARFADEAEARLWYVNNKSKVKILQVVYMEDRTDSFMRVPQGKD